jgi:hypothetical protein
VRRYTYIYIYVYIYIYTYIYIYIGEVIHIYIYIYILIRLHSAPRATAGISASRHNQLEALIFTLQGLTPHGNGYGPYEKMLGMGMGMGMA